RLLLHNTKMVNGEAEQHATKRNAVEVPSPPFYGGQWTIDRHCGASADIGPGNWPCQGNSIGRKKELIISVGELEIPRAAGGAVNGLDVSEAPLDLGGRVGLPVRARAGHLRAGQRLRDAVRAGGRVLRLVVPAALPVPDVELAGPLPRLAEAEGRQHVVRDALRGPRVGRRGADRGDTAAGRGARGARVARGGGL